MFSSSWESNTVLYKNCLDSLNFPSAHRCYNSSIQAVKKLTTILCRNHSSLARTCLAFHLQAICSSFTFLPHNISMTCPNLSIHIIDTLSQNPIISELLSSTFDKFMLSCSSLSRLLLQGWLFELIVFVCITLFRFQFFNFRPVLFSSA